MIPTVIPTASKLPYSFTLQIFNIRLSENSKSVLYSSTLIPIPFIQSHLKITKNYLWMTHLSTVVTVVLKTSEQRLRCQFALPGDFTSARPKCSFHLTVPKETKVLTMNYAIHFHLWIYVKCLQCKAKAPSLCFKSPVGWYCVFVLFSVDLSNLFGSLENKSYLWLKFNQAPEGRNYWASFYILCQ